jgi:hypothetical protein
VSKGARWQIVALGWSAAVVVTMLIAGWAISVVGHQLSSTVALPKPATGHSSQRPTPSTLPKPRPSASLPRRTQGGGGTVVVPTVGGVGAGSTGGSSSAGRPPVVRPGAGGGGGPTTRPPATRPPATRPPTTRPPSRVTDQRTVETDGGTAAFTCTNADHMSLLYATSAPGYTTEPPRIRSASRIEVNFVGGELEQKIDARCENGKVTFSVEH